MLQPPKFSSLSWSLCIAAGLLGMSLQLGRYSTANATEAYPVDRLGEAWWAERHQAVLHLVRNSPDTRLVLMGDSITQNYERNDPRFGDYRPIWKAFYEPYRALNLGFNGDTTDHLLWRLAHGEVDGLHPKVVVLLIGTNNTDAYRQSGARTAAGINAVLQDLERRLPDTRILLIGILPSGVSAVKSAKDASVNQYLAHRYAASGRVRFLDVGSVFFHAGQLDTSLFVESRLPGHPELLHPDPDGQRLLAAAIDPSLKQMLAAPSLWRIHEQVAGHIASPRHFAVKL